MINMNRNLSILLEQAQSQSFCRAILHSKLSNLGRPGSIQLVKAHRTI